MIRLDFQYIIPFETTDAGSRVAADATPTAVLYRNGSASGVSVAVTTTAVTGLYHATFTTASNWNAEDRLWLDVAATIDSEARAGIVWDSFGETSLAAVGVLVDASEAAILAAILNTVPLDPPTFTRSTADEKPIQFSWINGTDTLTATRSIDGGAFEAVAGAIAFFRNENSVAQYTLAYSAADRPTEEGTVRYKVTNGAITVVLTLRVEEPGGASVTVLPATGTSAGRGDRSTLVVFVGETITTSITAYQADRVTPLDLSGKSLVMVFEDKAGNDVATIANANITVSGPSSNIVTFAYPATVSQIERTLRWSLRDDAAPNTVYLLGLVEARRAAFVDPS